MTDFYRKDPEQPRDGEIYAGILILAQAHTSE